MSASVRQFCAAAAAAGSGRACASRAGVGQNRQVRHEQPDRKGLWMQRLAVAAGVSGC